MSLQRESATPLYLQVAQLLEGEIAGGRFPPYSRLMSESGLMRRFEVSRVTVRAAILRLAQKGLVDVRQGKGTFVAGPILRQELDTLTGLHDVLIAQGFQPDRRLLEFRPATREECSGTPFAAASAPPTLLRRLYVVHGKPFAVIHGLLASSVVGSSRRDAASQTIVEMLRKLDGGISRADITIRARPAAGDIGTLLALPRRRVVLQMQRTSYNGSGDVVDFSTFHIVPEAWEFRVDVVPKRPPAAKPMQRTIAGEAID